MTKIIVYDFDGTISDSMGMAIEAYNRIAKEKGFKFVTDNNLQTLRAKAPREILNELGVSLFQAPRLLYRVLREVKHIVVNLKSHAGMKEVIYKVRELGYQQAILTTNIEENVKGFLQNNEIDIFDFIYCGSSLFGKAKYLKRLIKDNHFAAEEVVYIGDEIRDIEAAKKAGVRIICVDWGYNTREALVQNKPYTVISKPEEILTSIT